MSLAESLRAAVRVRVPEAVLGVCDKHDRTVVENIITVLGEHLPVNLAQAAIERKGNTYVVSLPLPPDSEVSLTDLRQIEAYSPARVLDIRTTLRSNQTPVVKCIVGDENSPVVVAETDVVRVTKRRRWWNTSWSK